MPEASILETTLIGAGFLVLLGFMGWGVRTLAASLRGIYEEMRAHNETTRGLVSDIHAHVMRDSAIIQRLGDIHGGVVGLREDLTRRHDHRPAGYDDD